jgi:hypothetical protein
MNRQVLIAPAIARSAVTSRFCSAPQREHQLLSTSAVKFTRQHPRELREPQLRL